MIAPAPSLPAAPALPAAETTRLYAADWAAFRAWCARHEAVALPAAAATVAVFLQECAATLSAGTLARRAAAIGDRHRRYGHASPTADPAVKAVLRAARRPGAASATARRPPPPAPSVLVRMAEACPGDLTGRRDRALLLLAAAGLGRGALVGLDAEDIRFAAGGLDLALRASGGGDVRTLRLPPAPAPAICPVRALEDWLRLSDTQFGPVFRKIDRWGNVEYRRLGTDAVRRILARRSLARRSLARRSLGGRRRRAGGA